MYIWPYRYVDTWTVVESYLNPDHDQQPKVEEKTYFLFGILCGLALYNQNIIHMPFPLVLFKKLLRVKPSMEDMREFEPVVAE